MNNVEFKEIKVSLPELRIWLCDREIFMSLQDLRLLMVFLAEPYRCYSAAELITRIDLPSKAALHVLVSRLRSRLGQSYIVSIRGWGYAFARDRRNGGTQTT